jgi:hypothetical protein
VADRGTETLGGGREQDAFSETTFVVCVQIRNFRMDHNSNASAGSCKMSGVCSVDGR